MQFGKIFGYKTERIGNVFAIDAYQEFSHFEEKIEYDAEQYERCQCQNEKADDKWIVLNDCQHEPYYNILHTMFNRRIYLDYASMTPIDPAVAKTVLNYSGNGYANPSSWYGEGVAAKKVLDQSRRTVAEYIGAHSDEIIFTSGGTEANNIAIMGAIENIVRQGTKYSDLHIVTSAIEHSSVLECFNSLAKHGVNIDIIPVDTSGIVDINILKEKIIDNTVLVSIMMVNNEIGTIEPIKDVERLVRKSRNNNRFGSQYPLLHTDASQGMYVDIDVEKLGVSMLTLDAGKMYGPRGIGALYIRRQTPIAPTIFGGGQENGLRSGTENIPAIAGFAKAIDIISNEINSENKRLTDLRRQFIQGLKDVSDDAIINGGDNVSPHIASVSILGIDNEFFVMKLDALGVAASTKSSCLRDSGESYVLRSIGANSANTIRFSFGRYTRKADIKRVLNKIGRTISKVRSR